MIKHAIGFNELSKATKFRKFCRLLCETTGVSLVFVAPSDNVRDMLDYRREMALLCEFLRHKDDFLSKCRECDRRSCNEAVLRRKGFFYRCHAGLMDIVVPVFVEGLHVGTFMGGQLLPAAPDKASFKDFASGLKEYGYENKMLRKLFFANPWMEKTRLGNIVELVSLFAGHFQELGSRLLEERNSKSSVEEACDYIQAHLKEPLTLEGVSSKLGLSPPYFSSLFKKRTDEGFLEYVRRLRIEHAKRLLEDSNYEVSRVATESGFASIASFNRCFRQLSGTNPSAYRSRFRRSLAD